MGMALLSLRSERGQERLLQARWLFLPGQPPQPHLTVVELGTGPRSAETEVEEDQREAGKASRHAWGKTPWPPNHLEPQCGRVRSWDLICPEDGDAIGSVCFHERGHL